MADNPSSEDSNRLQINKEINQELREQISINSQLTDTFRNLKAETDDLLGINRRRSAADKELVSLANSLTKAGKENLELSRKGRRLDQAKYKVSKLQADIQREITSLTFLAKENEEAEADIRNNVIDYSRKIVSAENARRKILDEIEETEGGITKKQKKTLDRSSAYLEHLKNQNLTLTRNLSEESERIILLNRFLDGTEEVSDNIEKQIEFQREINQVTGITGELLEGVNRIGIRVLGGLGVNLGVISESFEKGRMAMSEFGKEIAKTRDIERQLTELREQNTKDASEFTVEVGKQLGLYSKTGKVLTGTAAQQKATVKQAELEKQLREGTTDTLARSRSLLKGITTFSGELGKILTDPAAIVGILLSNFREVNQANVEFQRLTGKSGPLIDANVNMRLATSVQYLELSTTLSERLGMNIAGAFSSQNIAAAAELMNLMGLTAEQAGQLALISETNATTVDSTLNTIVGQVNAYNRTNRVALNHGQIVNDIARASEETLASFADQPQKLTQAAAAARRLGLELSQVERIADSLLDFESSIEAELEAQLITGQNINLAKARELALSNDLEGVGKEIFNNTVGIEKFSRMNRIEQQSMAKALGMSRQELARIALERGIEVGLTNKALENAAGMTAEDLKRVEAMQQLTISIQKVGQALAGPAEFLAGMLSNSLGLYSTLGLITGLLVGKTIVAVKSLAAQLVRSGIAASIVRGALTGFAGLASIAAAAGLATYLMNRQPDKIKDGIISPDGGLMVSGPKGSIQLDPQDSIIAGTDLNTNGNNTAQNNDRLIRKVDELIMAVKEGGDVFMDSSKVGESLAIGTYKSS